MSFNNNKNKIFGIFGRTGSGKSTLVDLLSGMIKPTSGSIKVSDNHDIFENINTWQSCISFVPQEPILFNDSIKNNICLENNESLIDNDKLNYSIKLCGIDEILKKTI